MSQRDAALLMQYALKQALAKRNQSIKAALAAQRPGSRPQPDGIGTLQMTETRIYIGLNDAESRKQLYETEKYLDMLKAVCRSYQLAFSVDIEDGGYYHEDGEYVEETSLVLVLINAGRDTVKKIAQDLRTLFHQESVLVTEDSIGGYFVCEETHG